MNTDPGVISFFEKSENINYMLKKWIQVFIQKLEHLLIYINKPLDALFSLTKHCFILISQWSAKSQLKSILRQSLDLVWTLQKGILPAPPTQKLFPIPPANTVLDHVKHAQNIPIPQF